MPHHRAAAGVLQRALMLVIAVIVADPYIGDLSRNEILEALVESDHLHRRLQHGRLWRTKAKSYKPLQHSLSNNGCGMICSNEILSGPGPKNCLLWFTDHQPHQRCSVPDIRFSPLLRITKRVGGCRRPRVAHGKPGRFAQEIVAAGKIGGDYRFAEQHSLGQAPAESFCSMEGDKRITSCDQT